MSEKELIEARGLGKRYGPGRTAVDHVDMTVCAGEVYGFLGPNGAGKTTTMRMLLGMVRPTMGWARVVGRAPGDRRGLADIGALVESPGFYPYLSGRDNLRVMARYARLPDSRVDDVLEMVHLAERARDRYATYSLGMKQRLGVASALLKDPRVLVLDEPTNGLDPAGMADMRELIRELGIGNRTVLLSSHLLAEVQQVCDRVAVIVDGRVLVENTVEQLRGEAALLVRADPLERGRVCAARLLGEDRVRHDGEALRLRATLADAGKINRALFEAGVEVTELRPIERTLEEVFLELTGEAADSETALSRWLTEGRSADTAGVEGGGHSAE